MRYRALRRLTLVSALALASISAPAVAATVIGEQIDPVHSGIEPYLDVLAARVEQAGGRLTFTIETRGAIPLSLPDSSDALTYLWFLDTDENAGTGQPHGDLGSEFNVRAVVSLAYGGGFIDATGSEPGGGQGTVAIQGSTISITIWLPEINNASDFNWRCGTFGWVGGSYVPGNPETSITHSDTLPYVPPARVTVTTPILELCPSGPATGQVEVEVRDAQGAVLPTEDYTLAFNSTHEEVATVDGTGLVTAVAPPVESWRTPYIEVRADGLAADNTAVVRVNSIDVGVTHQLYPASHITYCVVPVIEGVDLGAITTDYEIVAATERAYLEQEFGIGTVPFHGGMSYLVLDVANDPATSVCGTSGNPIRLGWTYGDPVDNSCYIINEPPFQVPQWFVFWHEMGHNFTCASYGFNQFWMGPSDQHNIAYCEGLASLAALWSWKMVLARPYGLGPIARSDIARHFGESEAGFRDILANYQSGGANYDAIDPNVIDGILLEMFDQYGLKCWYDLYSTFLPADQPLPVSLDTREKQATWFVAAMSASSGIDLRSTFSGDYGFPIDYGAWTAILSAVQQRIALRTWVPLDAGEPANPAADRAARIEIAPNPIGERTVALLTLAPGGEVDLTIYDLGGRRVRKLLSRALPPGSHRIVWDATDDAGRRLPSGLYLARLTAPAGWSERKVVLLR